MKHWIGRWLVAVSVLHTLYAFVIFRSVFSFVIQRGVFNTVGNDPRIAAAVWFVLFGAALFVCGLAVSALEQSSPNRLPASLGWSLLALTVLGVVLMPASGFWLVFPPAVAIILRKPRIQSETHGP